jgi:hypothetical protein
VSTAVAIATESASPDAKKYLTPRQICNIMLPELFGYRPHVVTIHRLMGRGFRCANGERKFLKHTRIGRKILILREDALEFFQELAKASIKVADAHPDKPSEPRPATDKQRQAAIDAARAELRAPIKAAR